jgi:putative glutamine amidotransferase
MTPLTAITATITPEAGEYRRPQIALYAVYVSVLERQGLASVMLTPAHSQASCVALLRHCHGLVLSGGEDVDPARYGERARPGLGPVNPARDEMELAVLQAALERRIPVLGICRGMQLLNVYLGGTLYQDLPTERPDALGHRQEAWGLHAHEARIVEGSRLATIVGSTRIRTNSFHHQAIKDLAPGLVEVARTDDGLIEAVEAPDYPWVMGVQWHPERHEAKAPEADPDRRLLAAFAEAVRARAAEEA